MDGLCRTRRRVAPATSDRGWTDGENRRHPAGGKPQENMAMLRVHARERVLASTLIGAAALVAVVATGDAWQRVGTVTPGFNLMANLKTGLADRGGVEPLGLIRAVDGQPVRTHAELRALVEARPAGTTFRYAIERDGQLEEQSVPSRRVTLRDFKHF